MKNCEKLGRYAEADVARQRLVEVKEHELFRKKEAMRSRHLAEMLSVEETYVGEFATFQLAWQEKMDAFEARAEATLGDLKAKHDGELRDFQQRLLIRSAFPRHSKEYFNMRKIEEYLAKQKNYVAADAMREKADALGAEEEDKWNAARQEDLLAKEASLRSRLELEAEGVRSKVASQRTELERQRKRDLEGLLIRYNNAKADLERHHKLERGKADREMAQELKLIRGAMSRPPGR